jgi:hypothetical protein
MSQNSGKMSFTELVSFSLIAPFVGLVFPFLAAVYFLGFLMDVVGWLDT